MYTKFSVAFIVLVVIVGISECDDNSKARRMKGGPMGKQIEAMKAKCTANVDKIKPCLDQTKLSTASCADPCANFQKTMSECITDKKTSMACLKTAGVLPNPPKGGMKGNFGGKGRKGKKGVTTSSVSTAASG